MSFYFVKMRGPHGRLFLIPFEANAEKGDNPLKLEI